MGNNTDFFHVIYSDFTIAKVITDLHTQREEINKMQALKTDFTIKNFKNFEAAKSFQKLFNKMYRDGNKYNAFVDFEFTCAKKIKDYKDKRHQGEILSIGIVVTDKKNNIIDTFYSTVKPRYNPILSPYCMELTHLEQSEINKSKCSIDVLAEANAFINEYNIKKIICFGATDIIQTNRDLEWNKDLIKNYKKAKAFLNKLYNAQILMSYIINGSKNKIIGLSKAKYIYGLDSKVQHNALSDAIDLANVIYYLCFKKKINK